MKLLVTAEEPDLYALVDEEFGHSSFFVIFDTNTGNWEAFPNQAPQAGVGAGIFAAEQAIKLGPEVVLTGYIGPHGQKKLESAGIKIIQDEEGTVASAIDKWMKKNPSQCKASAAPARTAPPE